MRFIKFFFLHQTTPPGPIRGYLDPFLILATFHGVIQVFKRLPSVRGTGELRIPGVPDAGESRITGVPDTGESSFDFPLFF